MTELLQQALQEVARLSESEQDAAAVALLDYVQQMHDLRLTEAQVEEVRRRRADQKRTLVSHEDAKQRIARLGSQRRP